VDDAGRVSLVELRRCLAVWWRSVLDVCVRETRYGEREKPGENEEKAGWLAGWLAGIGWPVRIWKAMMGWDEMSWDARVMENGAHKVEAAAERATGARSSACGRWWCVVGG
jgi:hypothetical protein